MTKNGFISNASRFFLISSVLLFATKLFSLVASLYYANSQSVMHFSENFTEIAFYGVMVLGFLALNGEGVGYKRCRDRKHKKLMSRMKWFIVLNMLNMLFKNSVIFKISQEYPNNTFSGNVVRFFVSLILCLCSVSAFLAAVNIWYLIRDKKEKTLLPVEAVALTVSAFYFVIRVLNTASASFHITWFGASLRKMLSSTVLLGAFCLLQYAVDIVMFFCIQHHYAKLAAEDEEKKEQFQKTSLHAVSLYDEKGYGIDMLDDKFLPVAESAALE